MDYSYYTDGALCAVHNKGITMNAKEVQKARERNEWPMQDETWAEFMKRTGRDEDTGAAEAAGKVCNILLLFFLALACLAYISDALQMPLHMTLWVR